jgi:hypothetical protein
MCGEKKYTSARRKCALSPQLGPSCTQAAVTDQSHDVSELSHRRPSTSYIILECLTA